MPKTEKIYGNEAIQQAVLTAVQTDRLCHAYLLCGEEGIGKKTFALWMAQTILCSSPNPNGACQVCPSCIQVREDTHPDLYIAPDDKPLPVAAVREIRERSFIKPNAGKYNVFVIPKADRMESSSFNALLKVLEEPPGKTVFLLTAADISTTPQTISSRCVPVRLSKLSDEQMKIALQERTQQTSEQIVQAVSYADGNLGKALSVLEDEEYAKAVETANALYETLCKRKEYAFLQVVQSKIADKSAFLKVNEVLMHLLRREMLTGGKISGLKMSALLAILQFCQEMSQKLNRPYSMQLMTASYTAGIFSRIA